MTGGALPVVAGVHYSMPGVDQTTFADSIAGGNCLQACVATVLKEPLEMVPNFYLFGPRWVQALDLFFGVWGLTVTRDSDESGLTIAVGMSTRGVKHCIVCVNGKEVHDPHPSRAGLLKIDYHLGIWGSIYEDMHRSGIAAAIAEHLGAALLARGVRPDDCDALDEWVQR